MRFAALGNASPLASIVSLAFAIRSTLAQDAPSFTPEQLDKLVSRIALYPDPLLAKVKDLP